MAITKGGLLIPDVRAPLQPRRLNGTVAAFSALSAAGKNRRARVNRASPFGNQKSEILGPDASQHVWGHNMRKFLSFGIAAVLTIVAVAAWGAGGARPKTYAEITTGGIDPFVLMQQATDLQVQQYEPF
jgi:hypothetical protein